MTETTFTPGPWRASNMVHEEGRPMTPEELGEYVCNSVKVNPETRFLFISGDNGDGEVDVCHVGNGPRGPANANLIAAAPELLRIAEWFRESLVWHINKDLADGDDEGAQLKRNSLLIIDQTLEKARGLL